MQKKKRQQKQIGISLHRKHAKPINMKECFILLVIREMQIITIVYLFIVTRLTEFKKLEFFNSKSWQGCE